MALEGDQCVVLYRVCVCVCVCACACVCVCWCACVPVYTTCTKAITVQFALWYEIPSKILILITL